MDRRAQLLSMFDASGFGLEIGPSYNPFLAKASGYNVETLDHADQDALRAHYAQDRTVDPDRIEPVDYVSDGSSMVEIIGATGRYDFIVASHMIEHTPDLVGFLRDCEQLLKPEGVLVLAVPDNRYCFDKLRPLSSIGQVVEAAYEKRTRHTMASLFDHAAYYCELNGRGSWLRSEEGEVRIRYPLKHADERRSLHYRPEYTDNHAWQFTPSSFRLIVEDLHTLGLSGLREASFAETDLFEFQTVLARTGRGPGASRDELASRSLDEIADTAPSHRRTTAIDDHAPTIAALTADLETLRDELAAAETERDHLRHALEETRMARSWRFTAPLRAVATFFR